MNVLEFKSKIKEKGWGIDKIRSIENVSGILRGWRRAELDTSLIDTKESKDLIRIANLVPPDLPLPGLYSKKANRIQWHINLGSERATYLRLEDHAFTEYEDPFLDEKRLLRKLKANGRYPVEAEYRAIANRYFELTPYLFTHLKPINSLWKKIEVVRIYEMVRECREVADFFYMMRQEYFFPNHKWFAILFSVNFNDRINGMIDWNGDVRFETYKEPFFNGLHVQKIQRCQICYKFIWIEEGKNNVDKACLGEHDSTLKNLKKREQYTIDSEFISKRRMKAKTGKPIDLKLDQFTKRNFRQILPSKALANLYTAWTETFAFENKGIDRGTREHLPEAVITHPALIFDPDIFKYYLPCILRYRPDTDEERNSLEADVPELSARPEEQVLPLVDIIVPKQVYMYLARYYHSKGQKRLFEIWVTAAESDPYITRMPTEEDREIEDYFIEIAGSLSLKGTAISSSSERAEELALLGQCESLMTALVTKIPIATKAERHYRETFGNIHEINFIDSDIIFEK